MSLSNYNIFVTPVQGNQRPGKENQKVKVTFNSNLTSPEWQELREKMKEMIDEGYIFWEFNLSRLKSPTSTDLGMWVACNAVLTNYSGKMQFVVREDSMVKNLIRITKLDLILSIKLV